MPMAVCGTPSPEKTLAGCPCKIADPRQLRIVRINVSHFFFTFFSSCLILDTGILFLCYCIWCLPISCLIRFINSVVFLPARTMLIAVPVIYVEPKHPCGFLYDMLNIYRINTRIKYMYCKNISSIYENILLLYIYILYFTVCQIIF